MGVIQAIKMALDSIFSNKMRSFLTTLGIIIGVAAVIALVSVVDSVTNMITGTLASMGTNNINLLITGKGTTKKLEVEDMIDFVEEKSDLYEGVAPNLSSAVRVKYGTKNVDTSLTGTTVTYKEVEANTEEGRFFNEFDVEGKQKVAVIGTYIKNKLFGEQEAIGEKIKINGTVFQVIGVLKERQGAAQSGYDDIVIVPYTTAATLVKDNNVKTYVVKGTSSASSQQAKEELTKFLKKKLGTDEAFIAISQEEILSQVNTITGTMSMMLGGIAAISLVVGGIGIMNIMLVSVTERTREIGIRKAIGAKRRSILIQFLIEAIILSLLGGILGIGLGWTLTKIVGAVIDVETTVSTGVIVFSMGFSMAIGVFFGLYPANKASKLNPIDALRYE